MYTEVKKVRAINGDQFILDFRRLSSMGTMIKGGHFLEINKRNIWEAAKVVKIEYYMTRSIYVHQRDTMVIR